LHSDLPGNPRLFRRFSSPFAHKLHQEKRNRFSAAIAQELAGSAGKKNGEKRAGDRGCGKVRSW
jgi:hypothetical protein